MPGTLQPTNLRSAAGRRDLSRSPGLLTSCSQPARIVCAGLALLSLACAGAPRRSNQPSQPFDFVIRGASIVDGTGEDRRVADVGVRLGRIAAIGDLGQQPAHRVIEAHRRVLAPGFIDVHSHAADGLVRDRLRDARALLAQGITTVVVNPDGGGPVDLVAQRAALEQGGVGVHVAQLIGHGSIRRQVMGYEDAAPSEEQQVQMESLVRTAMTEGAFGLSSGTFYAPGSYAAPDEMVRLARAVSQMAGVYTSHIRDESNYTIGVVAAVQEVIDLAHDADITAVVTHVKALGPPVWGASAEIIARIEGARADGLRVYADQYPYEASATQLGAALLPRWAQVGGRDALLSRLGRADERERIRAAMRSNLERRGGAGRIQFRSAPAAPEVEGLRLDEVAAARGLEPLDLAIRLIEAGPVGIVSFNMNEEDVERLMAQPWVMTCSDGGLVVSGEGVPHPRNVGSFARKIETYVRERGVLSLEQAVYSMSGLPAHVFGLDQRGEVAVGRIADLVLFDPSRVAARADYGHPHALSEGFDWVWVAGRAAIEEGRFTGMRAGVVLHRERERTRTRSAASDR